MVINEFVKRIATAVVLIPIVIFVTNWHNVIPFAIGLYVIILLGNKEIYNILKAAHEPVSQTLSWAGAIFIPLCFVFKDRWAYFSLLLVALIFIIFLTKLFSPNPTENSIRYISSNIFGAMFFPLFMSFIWLVRTFDNGAMWIFFLFVAIWLSDSMAYFVGSKLGRKKIIPKVSPGKSLEGFIAGVVFGVAGSMIFYFIALRDGSSLSIVQAVIIAVDVVAAGIVGDLFESMLKRNAGVKDSGTLIPGHGGIFDRMDSLVFAAPVLFMYLNAWG